MSQDVTDREQLDGLGVESGADRSEVRICVDADGGDDAPRVVIEGLRIALDKDPYLNVLLVGRKDSISALAAEYPDRIEAVETTEVIEMADHPAQAVRRKKDSSIVVGCKLVHEGRANGFYSAGSTGGVLTGATILIGRPRNISRPALATIVPVPGKHVVLLDVGANADCKPGYIVQFAKMGIAYAKVMLGRENPQVGLLNNGSEETKGSMFAQEVHAALASSLDCFIGNVEGGDLTSATCDVVVTDGFTGNIALKVMEGLADLLFRSIKQVMTSSFGNKLAAAKLNKDLREFKSTVSPDTYGGAPLLGIKNVCVIGHGSSSPQAIANGVALCARAVRDDLPGHIAREMGE